MCWVSPTACSRKQLQTRCAIWLERRTPSHRHQPLAVDGGIDQGAQPQQAAEVEMRLGDLTQVGVRDQADPAGCECHHPVVHLLQQETMQVDEIARDMQGGELALPVPEQLVAGGEAFEQQAALAGALLLAHQVLI